MKLQNKPRGVFYEHRFAVFFFLYVVLYNYLIVNRLKVWTVSNITYAYHLVDYRFGFRSNLLPGAIYNAVFGQHVSRTTATVYETVLLLLFFAGASVLLDRFLCHVEQKDQRSAFLLILFYLSGPFTFSIFTGELGMLDVYWLFFSLLFFLALEKRGFRFLIPVLYILSMLVHFSSVLNYLLLFSIILLYRISLEPGEKTQRYYALIFILSISVTAGLFFFFLVNHSKELPVSMDEFHQILNEKDSDYFLYYDYSFYNIYGGEEVVPSSVYAVESPILRMILTVFYKCVFNLKAYTRTYKGTSIRLALTLLLAPVLCLFYRHLFRFLKEIQGNNLKRFCVILMMVQFPFTAVLGCMFSPDIIRWFTHAFLILFTMVFYVMFYEKTFRLSLLADIDRLKRLPATWAYILAYTFVNSWAYC